MTHEMVEDEGTLAKVLSGPQGDFLREALGVDAGPEGLGTIFDHLQAVLLGQRQQRRHRRRMAENMHRQ